MSQYCDLVTGDLDKRLETLKLYQSIYPRDSTAHLNLAVTYEMIGQYGLAVEESRLAIQLDPNSAARQATFINSLVHLNRFAEARLASQRADDRKLDDTSIHQNEYRMAFMSHDNTAMERQLQWAANRKERLHGPRLAGRNRRLPRAMEAIDWLRSARRRCRYPRRSK